MRTATAAAIVRARQTPFLIGAAAAMGVHLSAAGGWTVPGLSVMWLVLMTMILCNGDGGWLAGGGPAGGGLAGLQTGIEVRSIVTQGVVAALLVGLWMWSAWIPVSDAAEWMARGDAAFAKGRLGEASGDYDRAAEADPWDPLPALRRSEIAMWQLMRNAAGANRGLRPSNAGKRCSPKPCGAIPIAHGVVSERCEAPDDVSAVWCRAVPGRCGERFRSGAPVGSRRRAGGGPASGGRRRHRGTWRSRPSCGNGRNS